MQQFFDTLEQIFFTPILGEITLYVVLSTAMKFVFVLIALYFVYTITKMIFLDIRVAWKAEKLRVPRIRLEGDPERYAFPLMQEYYLSDNTTIGRADTNAIVLQDRRVGKMQAKIYRHNGDFLIEDLGATNPTLLNGIAVVGPQPLYNGDSLEMGGLLFTFLDGASDEA